MTFGDFDKEAYAFEELVAEIGAAMTCAFLQVTRELRHASYLADWLKVLKNDKTAILTAASWHRRRQITCAVSMSLLRLRLVETLKQLKILK